MYKTDHDRAVAECFDPHNGGDRDCDNCLACPDNGGGCCFAEKHQYGDKECRECIHESDCASVVHGHGHHQPAPKERSGRVLLRRGAVTQKGSNRLVSINKQRREKKTLLARNPNRTPAQQRPEVIEETDEAVAPTFVERLGRHVGWGMAEGGLQMALDFFTRNRPDD